MPNGERFRQPWETPFEEYEEPTPLTFYKGKGYDIRGSYDYLGRLQAYLQNLINTDPEFTREMAASMWQDAYNVLFPQPEWKERKPTDEELRAGAPYGQLIGEWATPTPKAIRNAPLFSKVQTYFAGLAEDVRAKEETNIAQYAEAQSALFSQMSALPLGRGGTPSEQMWTAEGAIRNLRLQQQQANLAMQTNPYLASTVALMEQQVGQLEGAQVRLREQARTEARIRTSQMEERERLPRQRAMVGMPSAQALYDPYLEGMSPQMRRYYERAAGQVYTEFERAHPGARMAWWQELQHRPEEVEPSPERTAGIEAFVGRYGRSPFEMPVGAEGTPMGAAAIGLGAGAEPRPEPPRDPWEAWLEDYQFAAKYIEQPRSVRGFYPRRSVARTRWFT